MIDFTFSPEVDEIRFKVRRLMDEVVRPRWESIDQQDRGQLIKTIVDLRKVAKEEWGVWLPHMPEEWGGMALGPTAMAAVSAEAAKVGIGPFVINAQAPDEGNQHTIEHWGTPEQKEKYLRPLCEGTARSCFAMTEPEVAGSDPTLIKTHAYRDGDEWIVNGHKWFISGARGAKFAILIARTEEDPEIPQAANTAFIVDLPSEGWNIVRDVHTMSGGHNHCEILIEDLRVPHANLLGGQGQGHLLGQYRLGPTGAAGAQCESWTRGATDALRTQRTASPTDRTTARRSRPPATSPCTSIGWSSAGVAGVPSGVRSRSRHGSRSPATAIEARATPAIRPGTAAAAGSVLVDLPPTRRMNVRLEVPCVRTDTWSHGSAATPPRDGDRGDAARDRLTNLRRMGHVVDVDLGIRHGRNVGPLPGVRLRQTRNLHPADVQPRRPDGIRLAGAARMMFDLGADLSPRDHASVVEQMLQEGRCSFTAMLLTARRLIHPARPGSIVVAGTLESRGDRRPLESHPEVEVAAALCAIGVPVEQRQLWLDLPNGGRARLDLSVPSIRWGIEIDVHPDHLLLEGTTRDKARDRQCHLIDWQIERVTKLDLVDLPGLAIELKSLYIARLAVARRGLSGVRRAPSSVRQRLRTTYSGERRCSAWRQVMRLPRCRRVRA